MLRRTRTCWLAQFTDTECDGPMDRAHIGIAKQRMRIKNLTDEQVWDKRIWRWCCRRHHTQLDHRIGLHLKREDIPQSVWEFADEHKLTWSLERDYPEEKAA